MPATAKALPWELSDALWAQAEPLLSQVGSKTRGRRRVRGKGGSRTRPPDRTVLASILYVLVPPLGTAWGLPPVRCRSPGLGNAKGRRRVARHFFKQAGGTGKGARESG
jgi:hypothetical protein